MRKLRSVQSCVQFIFCQLSPLLQSILLIGKHMRRTLQNQPNRAKICCRERGANAVPWKWKCPFLPCSSERFGLNFAIRVFVRIILTLIIFIVHLLQPGLALKNRRAPKTKASSKEQFSTDPSCSWWGRCELAASVIWTARSDPGGAASLGAFGTAAQQQAPVTVSLVPQCPRG